MNRLAVTLALLSLVPACGLEMTQRPATQRPGTSSQGGVDQGTPKSLAEGIFAAAKSRNYVALKDIASETADAEVVDIAKVDSADMELQELFHSHFASGQVAGRPHMDGKGAAFVPILYGKSGDQEKLLVLAQNDNKWFLDAIVDAVDQSTPEKLAESIFRAARTGIFSGMKGIAAEGADGEVMDIANVATAEADFQDMFRAAFGTGSVTGDAVTKDDRAMVPILFGKSGTTPETMVMVRKDGKWYFSAL